MKRLPWSVLMRRTPEVLEKGVRAFANRGKPVRKAKNKKAKSGAVAATLPAPGAIGVQLATLVDAVATTGEWVYEPKYDGYRTVATLNEGRVTLTTRGGKDWTDHFPTVGKALSHVRVKHAVMDGEIAYVLDDGRTDFQKLQNALKGAGAVDQLVYFVFDLLHYDGMDLTGEPLESRKDKLRTLLAGVKLPIKRGDHVRGDGQALFDKACKLGLRA